MSEDLDASDLTFKQKVRACWEVITYWPGMLGLVAVFSVIAALLEGVGLSFILPIIESVEGGGIGGEAGGDLMYWFKSAYAIAGVPFNLGSVILGIIIVMLLRFLATFAAKYTTDVFTYYYKSSLQEETYSNALRGKVAYFDHHGSDEILNIVITETRHVRNLLSTALGFMEVGCMAVVYLGLSFYISPGLMTVTIFLFGGITLLFRLVLEPGEQIGDRVAEANEQIQRTAQAGMQGIREVKAYNQKNEFRKQFSTSVWDYFRNSIQLRKNKNLIRVFYDFMTITAVFGLVYVAIEWTQLGIGAIGVFLVALFRLSPKISDLHSKWYNIAGKLPHLIRAQTFIDELKPLNPESRNGQLVEPVRRIQFENVHFAYDDEPVLSDVRFTIREHQTVAFVGPTGAGKSTIAELLSGFYPEYTGNIRINEDNLTDLDLEHWWTRLALVRQDPHIFNTTLRNNLLIGDQSASDTDIREVLDIAQVHEFLGDLDSGLDTMLGDEGVRLSGGQRQRVALARALLKDAELFILDEATSALDYETEENVYRELDTYLEDKMVVVIAHRLSTIKNADQIFFISDGRIRESGSHDELMEEEGEYHLLYERHDKRG